ncbi:MAG: archaeal proteasome endopeptidase complex subunit beta [Methanobacteriota archaeon]|nr:MAG: archaeal proteasome endopeptidase complex subunit beta [Euryarchaeota archaeon]
MNGMVQKLKTGTTTVGIVAKDAVVIAADKRATMGNFIMSKDVVKIMPFAPHMAMTLSGAVGDNQVLARWMALEARKYRVEHEKPMHPHAAVILLSNILSSSRYYPYWVMNLLAGFYEGKGYLYSVDLIGGVSEEKVASTGSGSVVAYGILDSGYKEEMSVKEAVSLAIKAVNAAMNRDSASGEGVDVYVIDKNGGNFLDKKALAKLLK